MTMFDLDHSTVTGFAKSFGLFYLIAMAIGVVAYAYWPSKKRDFDETARSIIHDEDVPWL